MTNRWDDESGLSLVEIAVSLVILGVVLTTFFGVITNGLQSMSEARNRQTASQYATELLEDLRALSPSEAAMYNDPTLIDTAEFDPASVSCAGTPGSFDPDGPGPLGCEVVVANDLGAITSTLPYQKAPGGGAGTVGEALDVTTIATAAADPNIPSGTVRVTVVVEYTLPSGTTQVRRSALFSEVARG